jgi:hypothetical protein
MFNPPAPKGGVLNNEQFAKVPFPRVAEALAEAQGDLGVKLLFGVDSTFNFSNPTQPLFYDILGNPVHGSGHVTFTGIGVLFEGEARHGFTAGDCRIVSGGASCPGGSVCILKLSNSTQGSVADCNNNAMPYQNNFQNRICCTPKEIFNDGIDNTGDGLIDCASPDCHQSPVNPTPMECTPDTSGGLPGNQQNTSECVRGSYKDALGNDITDYYEHCIGPHPDPFDETGWSDLSNWPSNFPGAFQYPVVNASYYCSYGIDDDGSQTGGRGFCCPPDTRAEYDDVLGWECIDFAECGVGGSYPCKEDYRSGFDVWLSEYYSNDANNWCVSRLPNYFNPLTYTFDRSMGCCFVYMYGKAGFYYHTNNVKIFGYE